MQENILIHQINNDIYRFEGKHSDEDKISIIITHMYSKYKIKNKFNISEINGIFKNN